MADIEEEYFQEDPVLERICYDELANIVYDNLPRSFLKLKDDEDFEEFRYHVMPGDGGDWKTAAEKAERYISFSASKFYKNTAFHKKYSRRIVIILNTKRGKVKLEELLLD
jgi:hypothetical protein